MTTAPEPNWTDQTIWAGDNLDIMRGMNSATVDLIKIDPPFNSNTDYTAPIGSQMGSQRIRWPDNTDRRVSNDIQRRTIQPRSFSA